MTLISVNVYISLMTFFYYTGIPLTGLTKGKLFREDEFTPCSETCGLGQQSQNIWYCVEHEDLEECQVIMATFRFRACNVFVCPGKLLNI